MRSLKDLDLSQAQYVYGYILSNGVFKRSLNSMRREHSEEQPCGNFAEHLRRPRSKSWERALPWLVLFAAFEHLIDVKHLPSAVTEAWSNGGEFRENILTDLRWVPLFREAGFSRDGVPADPPAEPLTLYRGCWARDCRGMSWTSSWHRAIKDAGDGHSDLYVVHARPEELLAHLTGNDGDEWVVDPVRMTLELVGPRDGCIGSDHETSG